MHSISKYNKRFRFLVCVINIFVVAERFMRTSKNKIYKYKISVSKNECVYIDKLADIISEYNNTYQSTILLM